MFERIYEAAINNDQSKLQEILASGCIDEHKQGRYYFPVVTQLSYENNITAVEFLLKNGANLNYAALGAAMGQHKDRVEELLHRGASAFHVAWGIGFSGDKKYALEFCALHKNSMPLVAHGAAMNGHRDFAECLITLGADIILVAEGAAIGGHIEHADDLIKRGAAIDEVALCAALGGNKDYAEKLMKQGADINHVAEGAAFGGDQKYAEELICRGASKDWVASGASKGGYRMFAESLRPDVDINGIAYGASYAGHRGYTEYLMGLGALSDAVVCGAYKGLHFDSEKSLMAYLSDYQPANMSILINGYRYKGLNISVATERQMIAISKHMHKNHLSYQEAVVITEPSYQGMLYLLMMLSFTHNTVLDEKLTLPWEIWQHILNFVTPVMLDEKAFENLSFMTGRAYLRAQLSSYQQSWLIKYRERAFSFSEAVLETNNRDEMNQLINKQVQVLQGDNSYDKNEQDKEYKTNLKNKVVDRYHHIISFWHKLDKGSTISFKDEPLLQFPSCHLL